MTCPDCGVELVVGSWPFCRGGHTPGSVTMIGDEIDIVQEHFSHTPERFRSKERMRQRMRELKIEPFVRHVDGSKTVSRWI